MNGVQQFARYCKRPHCYGNSHAVIMITQSVTCHPAEVTLCSDDSLSLHGVSFRKHKRTVWGLSVCLSRRAYAQSDSALTQQAYAWALLSRGTVHLLLLHNNGPLGLIQSASAHNHINMHTLYTEQFVKYTSKTLR